MSQHESKEMGGGTFCVREHSGFELLHERGKNRSITRESEGLLITKILRHI